MSVVILDFGSQYTRLIARRIRELGAYSVILPGSASRERILLESPEALILSGGPASVFDPGAPRLAPGVLELELPVLGICYGMQLLAQEAGGEVRRAGRREYGRAELEVEGGKLFQGLPRRLQVWMSHSDAVTRLPSDWSVVARTDENPVAAIEGPKGRFGVQFHPEVVHTPRGLDLLANFLKEAHVRCDWSPEQTLHALIDEIRARVGQRPVLLAVSGGVDSSTLALLLHRAVGPQLHAVFVDHGLLRWKEREEVEAALASLGPELQVVDAKERFLSALRGVVDPEEKRRIIGHTFIDVFREVAAQLPGENWFLAQGTLYPDVIESAGGGEGAAKIKSHHNVGGLPQELGMELLEPFRTLFKDEVRSLARLLGLPEALRLRHPFPGPGLAIRVLGEVTPERLEVARQADRIFIEMLREAGLYDQVWQALVVLLPVRSVGVVGDERSYGEVAVLRAVTSVDGMTADWARLPQEFLDDVARQLTQKVPQVGRVVYDITSKPPGTIEWE